MVKDEASPAGRRLNLFVQSLIVVSIIGFSIETLPDLPARFRSVLSGVELFCVAVFTIEIVLRTMASRPKTKYLFSFFGIVDILAVVPFYLSLGVDLRSLRVVRMLRMIRLMKLARYNSAYYRIAEAVRIAREELLIFAVGAVIMLYIAAVGIYHFENEAQPEAFGSVFHSMWWAVTTMTTVGYGDVYPVTTGGKFFTFFILMLGLGIIAIPTGIIASALTKVRERQVN